MTPSDPEFPESHDQPDIPIGRAPDGGQPDSLEDGLAAGFSPADSRFDARSSIIERIARRCSTTPRIRLREEPSAVAPKILRALSHGAPELPRGTGKYQLQGELARGGMGIVIKGHDVDLSRDVAMKVLHEKYVDNPDMVQRFVEEAQIGGQMQHPGIVPVYELGMNEGCPFFTMKLIKGRTLAALLEERQDVGKNRRLLTVFEQVCQTMAYAHARGVIHRDLKPANVMVGSFGEVQVVDWGMGKVLQSGGVADEERAQRSSELSVIETVRSQSGGPGTHSVAGSVMGTPAYMPPEQANGDVEHMDERSDVFALGAILCEILTGVPPYVGAADDLLPMAAKARLDPCKERLAACGADEALIELACDFLMPVPAARPRNAEVVAERVAQYLASVEERAQRAKIEAAESRVRATAAQRAHRLTLALAASVLLTLGIGGGGYWLFEKQQADRAARAGVKVHDVLNEARVARGRAENAGDALLWKAALTLATNAQAMASLDDVAPDLAQQVVRHLAEVSSQHAQVEAREQRLERERQALISLETIPIVPDESGGRKAGRKDKSDCARRDRAYREVFKEFGLPVESISADEARARISTLSRPEAWAAALDDWSLAASVLHPKGEASAHLLAVAKAADPDPTRCKLRNLMATNPIGAEELLLIADESTNSPPMTVILLAEMLSIRWKGPRAIALLRAAFARYPGDYHLAFRLANRLCVTNFALHGSHPDRVTREEGLRFASVAAALRPNSAPAAFLVGAALRHLNRLPEAEAAFRRTIELNAQQPQAYHNLAHILQDQGYPEKAVKHYEKAIELSKMTQVVGLHCLGEVMEFLGRADRAAEIRSEVNEMRRKSLELQVATAKRAVERDEHDARERIRFAVALMSMGQFNASLGQKSSATGQFNAALEQVNEAIKLDSSNALAHSNRGSVLVNQKQFRQASKAYRRAVDLDPDDDINVNGLGGVLFELGQIDDAIDVYRKATPSAMLQFNLARELHELGRHEDAITELRAAVRLDSSHVQALGMIGSLLQAKNRLEEAAAAFRDALRLNPYWALGHYNLGIVRWGQGRIADAAEAFGEAVRFRRNWAAAQGMEGRMLHELGQYEDAVVKLEKANKLRHQSLGWRDQTNAWLSEARHLAALRPQLERILNGEMQPSSAEEASHAARLARARKDYGLAARTYRTAFQMDSSLLSHDSNRYDAACVAVLCSAGKGRDASAVEVEQRVTWRKQALTWLEQEIKSLADSQPEEERKRLTWFLKDPDLISVRGSSALRRLPADERAGWTKVWKAMRARLAEIPVADKR